MTTNTLHHDLLTPAALDASSRDQLYAMFSRCYDCVTRLQFERDLEGKDLVILLRDDAGALHGFSTQQFFDWTFEDRPVRILFSGDTVIEPAFWGNQELVKGWYSMVAQALCARPERTLFWFLMSKGYRTYLYLPLFFRRFIPCHDDDAPPHWKVLLDELARHKFGTAYDPRTGLIEFPQSQGQLTPDLAALPPARQGDPHVRYFLERNPNYASGVELACLTEVSLENTHGLGRRWLGKAFKSCERIQVEN